MTVAIAKYIRMSPRKIRRVVNLVRGKSAHEAKAYLRLMPYAAARVVEKVLNSAVSNAKTNDHLNPDELKISKAYVDQATTLRRWRPMSRGRGYPILKRTSHLTIEVSLQEIQHGGIPHKKKEKPIHKEKHEHEHEHKHEHEEEKKEKKKNKKGDKD